MSLEIERATKEITDKLKAITVRHNITEFYSNEILDYINSLRHFPKIAELVTFFIWAWIDQTIFWILVDKRNKKRIKGKRIYNKFRIHFPFPTIWQEGMSPRMRPQELLNFDKINILGNESLLKDIKIKWWDNYVKLYFEEIGRPDIIDIAEAEFRRELSLRYRFTEEQENKLRSLWG